MKLTLTRRWIEHKQSEETKELHEGMQIEYYGNSVEKCSYGIVRQDFLQFSIEWEDLTERTILDGSEHYNKIIKDCGFGF